MFERPILIYSNFCSYSEKFIDSLMKHTDLFQSFIRINIDVDPTTRQRPKIFYDIQNTLKFRISEVPTIIVNNAEYILSGEEAFKWLEDVTTVNQEPEELSGFNPNEMGSFSDGYAMVGSTDMSEQTASQSFKFLNAQDQIIETPPEIESTVNSNDYIKKQQEREMFGNTPKPTFGNNKQNVVNNQQNFKSNKQNFGNNKQNFAMKGKVSQKQKEFESRYQELLMEREKLNPPIQRM